MTIAWSWPGATRWSSLRARSLDPLRRAQRLDLEPEVPVDLFLGRALLLQPLEPCSRDAAARSAARPRTAGRATRTAPIAADRHSSRCRASSTSRTIGLFRTSFLIAYSKSSALMPASRLRAASRFARADCARPRRRSGHGPLRQDRARRRRRLRKRAERVLDDPILERVKADDGQPRAGAAAAARPREERVEALELPVDPDAERLKRARRRIDPLIAPARHRAAHDRAPADRWSSIGRVARAPPRWRGRCAARSRSSPYW